jgi:sulfatase maturation enzyme AslB (radical SAM superfamily)
MWRVTSGACDARDTHQKREEHPMPHLAPAAVEPNLPSNALNFLWLEVTNRCSLECVHCYADSSPHGADSSLTIEDHARLIVEARTLGCPRLQFIGGEPTLYRGLPTLIELASSLEFETIEVYTNLYVLSDELLRCFARHGVHVATSVYSSDPHVHDAITTRPGSWLRTTRNIERVLEQTIPLRAAIVEMELNRGGLEATTAWLRSLGVTDIGTDRLRHFGRGAVSHACEMSELCGNCASGTLCVGPDGVVAPCIMSKPWTVGSVKDDTLAAIVNSPRLRDVRQAIYEQTDGHRQIAMGGCNPDRPNKCNPDYGSTCIPCSPNGICGPNKCRPNS